MTIKYTAKQKDKLIAAAQDAIPFTVTGKGEFPTDMLRYDRCWPASEGDSHFTYSQTWTAPCPVHLKGLKMPTSERWASFGWTVIEINGERVA